MSFLEYDSYQNSGVKWFGRVPSHWKIMPLKRCLERNDGGVWGKDPDGREGTIVLRSTEQTVDGRWIIKEPAHRELDDGEIASALLEEGDLLLTKSSGSALHIGKTTIVDSEIANLRCCYSNFMQRLRTSSQLIPRIAWYLLNNELSRQQFDYLASSTTGLANLNATVIGEVVIPVAPSVEQQAIAAFLDSETQKIDALVSEQRCLIELLKEKRQAVISHAVTKGLNPNAPMKPSSILWLGDVPKHWELKPLKYIGKIVSGFAFKSDAFSDSGVRVLKIANIQTFSLDWSDESFIPEPFYEDHQDFAVLNGDIVFALTRPIISTGLKAAIAQFGNERVLLNQRNAVFRPVEELDRDFVYHVLFSESFRVEFENKIDFTGQQPNISPLDIADIKIPYPPADEQEKIGSQLNEQVKLFSQLENNAEVAIKLLQERRAALISAAVTGKIDVRGFLSEEAAA